MNFPVAKYYLRVLAFFVVVLLFCQGQLLGQPKNTQVCLKGKCFEVEVARTIGQRCRGLSGRKFLPQNKGMLFVFDQPDRHGFWMNEMMLPLDIIWIDKDKKIVFISKNNQPCTKNSCPSVYPVSPAVWVLEVNAGAAESLGLAEGEQVQIDIP